MVWPATDEPPHKRWRYAKAAGAGSQSFERLMVAGTLFRSALAPLLRWDRRDRGAYPSHPVLTPEFFCSPSMPKVDSIFRACFVGRVEPAKGVGYLLQAWNRLALPNAELLLVGEIKPEMNSLLRRYADSTVRLTGIVTPRRLVHLLPGF